MRRLALTIGACAILAGCAMNDQDMGPPDAPAGSARADLRDANGRAMGEATAVQDGETIRVRIEGISMPPGGHGAHVHTVGSCAAPSFESAGPHWNPSGAMHGKDNPVGMHKGDLPNIAIGTDGRATLEYAIDYARIEGGGKPMLDADGAALVIHAAPDDYRTDPSGNSGARIACGVFVAG